MALRPNDVPVTTFAGKKERERVARGATGQQFFRKQVKKIERWIDVRLPEAAQDPTSCEYIFVDLPYRASVAVQKEIQRRYLAAGWSSAVFGEDWKETLRIELKR